MSSISGSRSPRARWPWSVRYLARIRSLRPLASVPGTMVAGPDPNACAASGVWTSTAPCGRAATLRALPGVAADVSMRIRPLSRRNRAGDRSSFSVPSTA